MARRKTGFPDHDCAVCPGIEALEKGHRNKVNWEGLEALESVNTDRCFELREPNAFRWDYYVGFGRQGECYLEVHEVSEDHLPRVLAKASWLRTKIEVLDWPCTPGRPLFVAPTKGISPFALYGDLSKRLALQGIQVLRKGDLLARSL